MHRKVLLCNSIVLLLAALSVMHVKVEGQVTTANPTTANPTTANPTTGETTQFTTQKRTTERRKQPPSKKPYKRPSYGQNYGGYDNDDSYGNDGYGNNNNRIVGNDGINPSQYGQDIADSGPVYSNQEPMLQSLDVWISAADDWETESKPGYRGQARNNYGGQNRNKYGGQSRNKYGGKNPSKGGYSNDDNYDDSDRKKRSYSRVRFPVRQFKDIRQFPLRRFPPLISIFPWVPIFYDKITYQTLIFSPTGGIYILPPLINFYGQRFAVAQLIKWGYASLVSGGSPPPPNVNVAPLVQPPPAGGVVTAGVVGSQSAGPPPSYDANKGRFSGGVKTDFPAFKPRYSESIQEDGYRNNGPSQSYGGTGRQEVYAQGGQRSGGRYN